MRTCEVVVNQRYSVNDTIVGFGGVLLFKEKINSAILLDLMTLS